MSAGEISSADISSRSSQLAKLRPCVEAETGMDFSGDRIARLADAVDKVLARNQFGTSLDQALDGSRQRAPFLERVTSELTVGESYFFRNEHHFRVLEHQVIPQILDDNAHKCEVRIWSAGCAGGEEPYSLAILLDRILSRRASAIATHRRWQVSILGTDLNPEFLERARAASFRPWSFRHTTIYQDPRYFTRDGDVYRMTPRLRQWVRFAYLNLVKDVYPSPRTGTLGLDLILFRNVAIYLKSQVTRAIIDRLYRALRPGGWLLLGETEVAGVTTDAFETQRFDQATFHRKPLPQRPGSDNPLPATSPVLAEFVDTGTRQGIGSPSIPTRGDVASTSHRLPDWLPLRKDVSVRRVLSGSKTAEEDATYSVPSDPSSHSLQRCLTAGRFDEAERLIERITNRQGRAQMRLQLVQTLLSRAEIPRARTMLDRTVMENPLLMEAQLLQASLAEEAGNWGEAEAAYRRALYIDRHCPLAHFHLGLVHQQCGRHEAARRSLTTSLSLMEKRNPHDCVEHGEGVCYGRLREMAMTILDG